METLQSTIETSTPSPVLSSGTRGTGSPSASASERSFVEALVDPVNVFADPAEVAEHPWFTHEEKRTILLSWARDELVVEQVAKKLTPELQPRSRIDAVIEALSQFDPPAASEYRAAAAAIRASHLRGNRRKRGH
jgi:hypothetical protein